MMITEGFVKNSEKCEI